MTTILAIETSTELASVSLKTETQCISRDLSGVQTHSHGILPAVQEVLKEANIDLNTLSALAVGCGPGAFTGVRTACGVIQGIAFGLDLPVLPVVSLMAMAEAAHVRWAWNECICVLDARMGEVYSAHYRFEQGNWHEVVAPELSSLEQVLKQASDHDLALVIGNGLSVPSQFSHLIHRFEMPHAQFVVHIAQRNLSLGLQVDATQAQPLYLRNKVALTTEERLQARGERQ